MRERRKDKRIPESGILQVHVVSASGLPELDGKTFPCSASNIASQGLRLTCPCEIPAGTQLELRIAVPGPSLIFTHWGKVRWSRAGTENGTFHAGILFTDSSKTTMEAWHHYVVNRSGPTVRWDDHLNGAGDFISAG